MISFFVPGIPVAQGRPRFKAIRMGAFSKVQVYDPKKSEEWKEHIRCVAYKVLEERKGVVIAGISVYLKDWLKGKPVTMTLRFVLPRPHRLPKRIQYPTKKPDLDNLVKAVKDALGGTRAKRKKGVIVQLARPGLVYANDSQVVDLHATKRYGPLPGVHITVKEKA